MNISSGDVTARKSSEKSGLCEIPQDEKPNIESSEPTGSTWIIDGEGNKVLHSTTTNCATMTNEAAPVQARYTIPMTRKGVKTTKVPKVSSFSTNELEEELLVEFEGRKKAPRNSTWFRILE